MQLFVVSDMQHPFQGRITVKPEGLELMLQQFGATANTGVAVTPTP
jgi:hypothetical protein